MQLVGLWGFTQGGFRMSGGTVAELVKGLHDEAACGMVDVMNRYANMVRKAATGKLTQDEAATAASIAYEMGLPVNRFDRDVAVVKAERALAAQMVADATAKSESRAKHEWHRERIKALQDEIRQAEAAMARANGESMMRAQRRSDHARLLAENPHLFKPADRLSDTEWQAVRSAQ